jgi:hypothetical protein
VSFKKWCQTLKTTFSSYTNGPNLLNLGRNVPGIELIKMFSKNSIPCSFLVAMAMERKNLKNLIVKKKAFKVVQTVLIISCIECYNWH